MLLRQVVAATLVPLDDRVITPLPMLVLLVCKPWRNEEVIIQMVSAVGVAAAVEEEQHSSRPIHSLSLQTQAVNYKFSFRRPTS